MPTVTIERIGVRRRGGQPGHAAGFTNGPYLSWANSGNMFTVISQHRADLAFWVKFDALPAATYQKIFHVGSGTTATDLLGVQYDPNALAVTAYSSNGSSYSNLSAGFTPTINTWYGFLIGYDAANTPVLDMSAYNLNGSTIGTWSVGNNGFSSLLRPPVFIGSGNAGGSPLQGTVDSLAWAPSGMVASLFGAGHAIDYATLTSAQAAGITAFYNLDEGSGSGVWSDASGSGQSMTAAGLVLSRAGAGF